MIPRTKFALLPTAVEAMPRLSAALNGPKLWVKRDDQTGLAMGGNKTRKLEFVLAEAQAHGARTLITVGAAQSNHARQTAALAKKFGLDCILVLSGKEPELYTGNLLLDKLLGAEIIWSRYEDREDVLKRTFEDAWAAGRRPHLIPLGASDAVGTMGYYFAFQEMLDQQKDFDWIVVASSSGGTQAGLTLGASKADWPGKVLGISIDLPQRELQEKVAGLVNQAADKYLLDTALKPEQILVNDDYLGAGYGVLGEREVEAIQLFARFEGIFLDPVYTGRAAAGLIDLIRKGFFTRDDRVLFWHTGGQPALFGDRYTLELNR